MSAKHVWNIVRVHSSAGMACRQLTEGVPYREAVNLLRAMVSQEVNHLGKATVAKVTRTPGAALIECGTATNHVQWTIFFCLEQVS